MILKVRVSFKLDIKGTSWNTTRCLKMIVHFKENKFFALGDVVERIVVMEENTAKFIKQANDFLVDESKVIKVAKEMIENKFEGMRVNEETRKLLNKLEEEVKTKEIEFEFEFETEKK